ncbi:MAG: cytochrome d ubiquinol oxidase subunit II [Actinomycetota bacterium]
MAYEKLVLVVLMVGLTLYAWLGGADLGRGVWELLSMGRGGRERRGALSEAMGPVWEANHVWLIFALVVTFAAFPHAFEPIVVGLYLPVSLAVLGLLLRGSAFAFHVQDSAGVLWRSAWTCVFGVASVAAPFFFGASVAALATGRIRVSAGGEVRAAIIGSWTGLLSLVCGILAVAICAHLAATYMALRCSVRNERDLAEEFRGRALVSGGAVAVFAALGIAAVRADAPELWVQMPHRGLPFIVLFAAAMIVGSVGLAVGRFAMARISSAIAAAAVLWGWALAQWPRLIVPDVTASSAAAPQATLKALVVVVAIAVPIAVPSLALLFRIFGPARSESASRPRS